MVSVLFSSYHTQEKTFKTFTLSLDAQTQHWALCPPWMSYSSNHWLRDRNTHWTGHQSNTHIPSHTSTGLESPVNLMDMHIFGLWEETSQPTQTICPPALRTQEFTTEASSWQPRAAAKMAQLGRAAANWGKTSQPLSRADTISQPVSPDRQSLLSQYRANETLHSTPQHSDKLLCLLSSQRRHWCGPPPPPQP